MKAKSPELAGSIKNAIDRFAGPILVLPALIVFIPFTVIPALGTISFSLFQWSGTGLQTMEYIGLDNYVRLFEDPVFYTALFNSLLFVASIVALEVVLGIVLAIILSEEGRFFKAFQVTFVVPLTLSYIVITVMASILFSPTYEVMNSLLKNIGMGFLVNPWLADVTMSKVVIIMVSVWKRFGFGMLLFIARIKQIPDDLFDAATVDGVGYLQKARYIIMPQLRQIIVVVVMLEVIQTFRLFDQVFALTGGGPNNQTHVLATYAYRSGFYYSEMGYGSAVLFLLMLVAGIITFLQLRFLWRREEAA